MKQRRALQCVVLLALVSSETLAQTAPTTPPVTTPVDPDAVARSSFEQGVTAMADERYTDALMLFNRSYEIRRAASVALNLGITLRALGRLVEARVRFNEFLEVASTTLRERHGRDVTNFLADISRRIGRVHLTALEPSSARINVDGRRVAVDENDDVQIDPGEHRVEASAQGFTSLSLPVQITSGARIELTFRLQPAVPTTVSDPRVSLTTQEGGSRTTTIANGAVGTAGPNQNGTTIGRDRLPPPSGSVLSSAWLWIGVGVGVAAAVTIPAVLLTRGPDYPNYPGAFCIRTDGLACN